MTRRSQAVALLLLTVVPTLLLAQGAVAPRMITPFKGLSGPASGSSISGCTTAGALLYMDASALLACPGAPAPSYDATTNLLKFGTGTTTQVGLQLGYANSSGYGGIYHSNATPSGTNFVFMTNNSNTLINSPTGSVFIRAANDTKIEFAPTAGKGPAITAGTAVSDVQSLSTTQTWNASGVTFTGHKYTVTDTASASGSLHSQWLGGAAGTTTLMSLSRLGRITVNNGVRTGVESGGNGTVDITGYSADIGFGSNVALRWESTATITGANDTGLSRISAGVVGVGTGAAASTAGTLELKEVRSTTTKTLTDNTIATFATQTLGNDTGGGGTIWYTVTAQDATTFGYESGQITFVGGDATSGAGGEVCTTPTKFGNVQALSGSTLTVTFAASTGTDLCNLRVTADTDIVTPVTLSIKWGVLNSGRVITPQ